MKIEIENKGRDVVVRTKHASWTRAAKVIARNREFPPDGYRLISSQISRRGQTGRAANLKMVFRLCTGQVDPFTEDEAYEHFSWIEMS